MNQVVATVLNIIITSVCTSCPFLHLCPMIPSPTNFPVHVVYNIYVCVYVPGSTIGLRLCATLSICLYGQN